MAPASPRPVTPLDLIAAHIERAIDRAGEGADPDLIDELNRARELATGLVPYAERVSSQPSEALRALERRTREADWREHDGPVAVEQEMLSGQLEGAALGFLIAATGARQVLEIGMFTGYSALAMAEALPPGGSLVACEIDGRVAEFAREGFGESDAAERIDVRVAPAAATLASLISDEESFDLIFIDADKPGYVDYLDTILAGDLLAPGGLICVDNTLLQGEPYLDDARSANGEAIAAFNDRVAADLALEQVLLPLRDGLSLIRRAGPVR